MQVNFSHQTAIAIRYPMIVALFAIFCRGPGRR
jgi:hypothetical protein